MARKENIKATITLSKEDKQKLIEALLKNGEASIGGLVVLKLGTITMKGMERVDPEDHSKGFRFTDINKTHTTIKAMVSTQFKRVVKEKKLAL